MKTDSMADQPVIEKQKSSLESDCKSHRYYSITIINKDDNELISIS